MPLFGAALAAPNKGTTVLFWFRSLSTVLIPTENRRVQGRFMTFVWFSSTFQGIFNFERTFKVSPLNSSTFQACANPVVTTIVCGWFVFGLCFDMQYFVLSSFLFLSSFWRRDSWLIYFYCLVDFIRLLSFSDSSSWCRWLVCGLWLWHFVFILM